MSDSLNSSHCPTKRDRDVVLVALCGMSPAVITETVYALSQEPEPIWPDRIIVITTSIGRQLLHEQLFDSGAWSLFRQQLLRESQEAPDHALRFGPVDDCIRVIPTHNRLQYLKDIASLEDNMATAEFLMELLRGLCEDESIDVYASIAGGRKTMGALLVSIMNLIGRHQDRIIHVLVNTPWDRVPDFLYPGCPGQFTHPATGDALDSHDAEVKLAELPFVPLRYAFSQEFRRFSSGYQRLVTALRHRVVDEAGALSITCVPGDGSLCINEQTIALPHLEFAFYLCFLDRASKAGGEEVAYSGLDKQMRELARQYQVDDDYAHWSHSVLEARIDPKEDLRRYAHNIRRRMGSAGFSQMAVDRLVPRRGRLSIDLPAEAIQLEPTCRQAKKP